MTESKSILETLLHEAYQTKEDEKQNIEQEKHDIVKKLE